jgi:hypothetical protein
MRINKLPETFGRKAQNRLDHTKEKSLEGAISCLETFYYAFNNKDLEIFKKIWFNDALIQLNNPLGGIIRGIHPIIELYERIFNGPASVWVEFSDIVYYQSADMITFVGRETGEFSINNQKINLQIRTTRFFGYADKDNQWFQIHHHGSIDNAELLDSYQKAVKK